MADRLSMVETPRSTSPLSFLSVLYKNLVLIILLTVLCTACGVLYGVLKTKPIYTASLSVILKTEVSDYSGEMSSERNEATLAKIYLRDVERAIKTPKVLEKANSIYNVEGDKLSAGAISINYGASSLIFSISYSALDVDVAKAKLSALVQASAEKLEEVIEAESVTLIEVQNKIDVKESSSFNKVVVFSAFVGLLISLVIVFVKYALDNTVKSKSEFEYITGVSVLAVIDKVEENKNKKK